MSKLLRLPLLLLAVLALVLLSAGLATADTTPPPTPEQCAADADLEGCEAPVAGEILADVGLQGPADEQTPPGDTGTLDQSKGVLADVAARVAANQPAATTGEETKEGTGTGGKEAAEPDPADIPTCIASAVQDLITGLQALSPTMPDPTTLLGATLPSLDPSDAQAIQKLLAQIGISQGNLAAGQILFQDAIAAIQACFPEPPAGGTPPPNNPPDRQPVQQPTQPSGVYYANCDDARAQGATNIPRGTPGYRPELDRDNDGFGCDEETQQVVAAAQPTGKLAYTGVDVEGLIRLGAILISGGTLVLLAGVRREA